MKLSFALGSLLLMLPVDGYSQENSCVLLQKLANNLGCLGASGQAFSEKNFKDEVISSVFSSESCLTARALEDSKAKQKKDCQSWLNEQKKELGSKYVAGSCKSECLPCNEGAQKCSSTGEARYRLDNRTQ
jgi:hypothetical protein